MKYLPKLWMSETAESVKASAFTIAAYLPRIIAYATKSLTELSVRTKRVNIHFDATVFAKASSSDKYCQFVYPISQPLSTHDLASFCSYANWTSKSRALKLRNHCWKIAGLNMSQNHGVSSKFRKKVCRLLRNRYSMVTYAIQNILNTDNSISDMVEVFRNTVSQKALELLGLR